MAASATTSAYASVPLLLRQQEGEGPATPLELIDRIEAGLPLEFLFSVTGAVSPGSHALALRVVPKATLARRRREGRLSPGEGAVVARLARIWSHALEAWGCPEAARAFLERPHPMLEDRKPLDLVLQSEIGGEMVSQILGRLQYGTAA